MNLLKMRQPICQLVTIALMLAKVSFALQDLVASPNNATTEMMMPKPSLVGANLTTNSTTESDEERRYNIYKNSSYYLASYDLSMKSMPDVQLEFVRSSIKADHELYRTILKEAIDKRNNFAPSVALMFKYSGKLLGNFIHNRQTELRLGQHKDIKLSFFEMLAKLIESIIDRSNSIKREKNYSKKSVDVIDLYRRVDGALNYTQRILDASPVGYYLAWDQMVLYRNESSRPDHDKSLIEEASDLLAQFRAMGYESSIFVARRINNLLRMFARGLVPSVKEVRR